MFIRDDRNILRDERGNKVDESVYIIKIVGKSYRHIILPYTKDGHCPACGKESKTRAHHLFPRRMGIKNKYLVDLRINLCDDCHKQIHPENKYFYNGASSGGDPSMSGI